MVRSPRDLDRSSPVPLWAQLERELRARVDAGEFDERFPTDAELVDTYGVSRHTVREAVRRLGEEGLLLRERGRGTVVQRHAFEQPLGALYSLFSSIEAQGEAQHSTVLELDVRRDPQAAAELDLDPHAALVHLARIRFAGEEPLAIDRVWLPATIAGPLLDADWTRTALYRELAQRCGVRPDRARERIRPLVPDAAERRALGMGAGEAAFCIRRWSWTQGRPLEWRVSVVRGDRFHFVADWTAGGPPSELRLAPDP